MSEVYDPTWPIAGPSSPPISAGGRGNFSALQMLSPISWVADGAFHIWAGGTTVAPTCWDTSGAGHSVARSTGTVKTGSGSAQLTAGGGAAAKLYQRLLPSLPTFLRGREFSAGGWFYTASASGVRLYINDGIGVTYSSYHPAGSVFSFLSLTRAMDASATKLEVGMECASGVVGIASGIVCWPGPIKPKEYYSCPVRHSTHSWFISGVQAAGTGKGFLSFARPAYLKDVMLHAGTAPTGQALIVDVNTWSGSAFHSAFSTRPQIAAGNNYGSAQPDAGNYDWRCVSGLFGSGTNPVAGARVSFDIDQVGSGVAGSDLEVCVRYLEFLRPQEWALAYSDIK